MAPFTNFGLALDAAPNGCIRFQSLEFVNIDGPTPIFGFHPSQDLHLDGLEYVTYHLGPSHLGAGITPPPRMSMPIFSIDPG
jgi:hypothetical protein